MKWCTVSWAAGQFFDVFCPNSEMSWCIIAIKKLRFCATINQDMRRCPLLLDWKIFAAHSFCISCLQQVQICQDLSAHNCKIRSPPAPDVISQVRLASAKSELEGRFWMLFSYCSRQISAGDAPLLLWHGEKENNCAFLRVWWQVEVQSPLRSVVGATCDAVRIRSYPSTMHVPCGKEPRPVNFCQVGSNFKDAACIRLARDLQEMFGPGGGSAKPCSGNSWRWSRAHFRRWADSGCLTFKAWQQWYSGQAWTPRSHILQSGLVLWQADSSEKRPWHQCCEVFLIDSSFLHWFVKRNKLMAIAGSLNLTEAHCMRPQHENERTMND